jgi:hypothetical protein
MPPNNAIPASVGGPTYGPLFFGSAVLGDGTVLVIGGELNTGVKNAELAAAIPWREDDVRSLMARLKEGGLTLGNMMISGFPNTLYGRPGRDEEIESVQQSIRAAGRAGLPVVEYNFYAHRAVEGYRAVRTPLMML